MRQVKNIKKIIIKIGSQSLVKDDFSIDEAKIEALSQQIKKMLLKNQDIILVTSGAIAVGMNKLSLKTRPRDMALKQACAALGQASLMGIYEKQFLQEGMLCAQILVNHDDFSNRKRMVNLKKTLFTLMQRHIVAVINENDALAVEEIKVGDNDTLAAYIASAVEADLLILLSDIDGLCDKNPKEYQDAVVIDYVDEIDDKIINMIGKKKTNIGSGGMETKIKAAHIATNAGCHMVITNANNLNNIEKVLNGENIGTWFKAAQSVVPLKDHWLIFDSQAKGSIFVDDGAKNALIQNGKSLLPQGIIAVEGDFLVSAVVYIKDSMAKIIAKGSVNYNSDEIKKTIGMCSANLKKYLGPKKEIIHANNLVVLEGKNYGIIN